MRSFRPFEYMEWAKTVPSGAGYAMHLSGVGPPPALPIAAPGWDAWTAPPIPLQEAFLNALLGYLGAPSRDGLVVSGASEAVFVALAAHVRRGDAVIVERPAYGAIERSVEFLGGKPVSLERREGDGWRLEPARLDALLGETGAHVVALTDPHNPTGVSIDSEARRMIVDAVERHGALLIVDEVFAPFRGRDRPAAWAASADRVLTAGSLAKGWGLSALRCGWLVGAAPLIRQCTQVFDLLGVLAPSATLSLAREALSFAAQLDARALQASETARSVYAATDWGAASIAPIEDGIIGFLRVSAGWTSERATAALRSLDGVQVVPGHFFGSDTHLRIGFDPEQTDGAAACRLIAARLNVPPPA